ERQFWPRVSAAAHCDRSSSQNCYAEQFHAVSASRLMTLLRFLRIIFIMNRMKKRGVTTNISNATHQKNVAIGPRFENSMPSISQMKQSGRNTKIPRTTTITDTNQYVSTN